MHFYIFITIIGMFFVSGCNMTSPQSTQPSQSPLRIKIASPVKTILSPTPPQASSTASEFSRLEAEYQKAYKLYNSYEYSDAIRICNQILDREPKHYKALTVKGIAICYTDTLQKGMYYIDKALAIKPDFGYARYNKALAYERFGLHEKSLEWYKKALEVEEYVWTYYGIASLYGRIGDVKNTVFYLNKAKALDPVVKVLAPKEEDFKTVWNDPLFTEAMK